MTNLWLRLQRTTKEYRKFKFDARQSVGVKLNISERGLKFEIQKLFLLIFCMQLLKMSFLT